MFSHVHILALFQLQSKLDSRAYLHVVLVGNSKNLMQSYCSSFKKRSIHIVVSSCEILYQTRKIIGIKAYVKISSFLIISYARKMQRMIFNRDVVETSYYNKR